jgi:cytochrome c oxidase subunit 2
MTGTRMRSHAMIALAALLLIGAACGSDDDTGGTPTGGGGASPTTGGAGEDDGASGSAAVTVQVNNFLFAPSDIEVAAGSEIEVKNGNANTPHTFTVEGTDVDLELSPMDSEDLTIDLDPGSYDVICRFHGQMTATLTVT